MGQFDLIVILVFSLLIFICGISFAKSGSNMKSFFAAGGSLPWWMSGLSLFMSFFSAGTFVVWGSIAYTSGMVAVSIQWTMCIAGIIIGFWIAPKWRKTNSLTAAEFITKRLGGKTQKIYTYLFLFISLFNTGAFLYPVAKIVEVSTGIPIYSSIIFLGLLILIYTAVGGLWAVIVTDVLQFVVLTAAVLIVVPLSFHEIGGVNNFFTEAPENFFNFLTDEFSWLFIVAFGLYNLFFIAGNWTFVQKYTSVSTPKDAKRVGLTFGALYSISPLIWMLPPMIYKFINPDLQGLESEGAYLMMCKQVLPVGMLGLMIGGMIFATSSSVSTTLNISAGIISNDLYKHLFPNTSSKKLVKIGRIATIIFGVITIGIALLVPYMGGIVEVVLSVAAITGGSMFLPPLWTLFSKRQRGFSTLTVTIISLCINTFFKLLTPILFSLSLTRTQEMVLGILAPISLLALFEIYYKIKNKSNPDYDSYLKKINNDFQDNDIDEVDESANKRGKRVIGIGIASIGILITLIAIIGNAESYLSHTIGIIVLSLGLYIIKINLK